MASAKSDANVVFLELNWEDTTTFSIPESDLVKCVSFIHEARSSGGSVLVHCAQVYACHMMSHDIAIGQTFEIVIFRVSPGLLQL